MICQECGKELTGKQTILCAARACENRYFRKRLRAEALAAYGNKCARCGFDDPRALQFDHKKGGGAQHFKTLGGSSHFLWWLKRNGFPQEEFQILCANCNWIKRHENNECHRGIGG